MKAKVDRRNLYRLWSMSISMPRSFEMKDDGKSHVIADPVPDGVEDSAKEAEESCPVDAIEVE